MILGITGTQKGITKKQLKTFIDLLIELNIDEMHHGDCIGADYDAHMFCRKYKNNTKIIVHPPIDDKKRANCEGDVILDPKKYLQRNHDIVDTCNLLIGFPYTGTEVTRSGTWATIRYARKIRKDYMLIFPNGELSIIEYNEKFGEEE